MQMPNEEIKCLRDIHRLIKIKKKEMIPVNQIWTLYRKYNEYHNCDKHGDELQGRFHYRKDNNILCFLIDKIYLIRCTDLRLISMVIKRLYAEGFRFNILVSSLFDEDKKFATNEIIPMFEYYLKYTYMNKTLFNGRRMASIGCFFSGLMFEENYYTPHLPEIMRLLIQYGIFLPPKTGEAATVRNNTEKPRTNDPENSDIETCDRETDSDDFTFELLWYSIFNEGIIRNNPHFLPINYLSDTKKERVIICVEIANMFLRSSLKISLSIFLHRLRYLDSYWADSFGCDDLAKSWNQSTTDIANFIHKLGRFIPQLPKPCLEPLSLKHGCKCIIRKSLHLNWKLPGGIFHLNLPTSLAQYLNLEID